MGRMLCVLILPVLGVAACRSGFQVPRGPCDGVDCSVHGQCLVVEQVPACSCLPGYRAEGLTCVAETEPCASVRCSDHGRCVVLDGALRCVCDPGYSNAAPTECVVADTLCDGVDCDNLGTCVVTQTALVTCACLPGYHNAGPTSCEFDWPP